MGVVTALERKPKGPVRRSVVAALDRFVDSLGSVTSGVDPSIVAGREDSPLDR